MKYIKKRNQYEASNVKYNPVTKQAHSYDWWRFVTVVDGLTIFNWYSYSNSTRKHQWKVYRLMGSLSHHIDIEVNFKPSLEDKTSIIRNEQDAVNNKIAALKAEINVKGSHKKVNARRQASINELIEHLVKFNHKMGVDEYSLIFDNVLNKIDAVKA